MERKHVMYSNIIAHKDSSKTLVKKYLHTSGERSMSAVFPAAICVSVTVRLRIQNRRDSATLTRAACIGHKILSFYWDAFKMAAGKTNKCGCTHTYAYKHTSTGMDEWCEESLTSVSRLLASAEETSFQRTEKEDSNIWIITELQELMDTRTSALSVAVFSVIDTKLSRMSQTTGQSWTRFFSDWTWSS